MIHLIWSKDHSSTSEDGKELKGIRSRLLECYRSLYFDPLPDLEPKQQINRIAKNMIEYVHAIFAVHYILTEAQAHVRCHSRGTDIIGRDDAHDDGRRSDT